MDQLGSVHTPQIPLLDKMRDTEGIEEKGRGEINGRRESLTLIAFACSDSAIRPTERDNSSFVHGRRLHVGRLYSRE